MNANNTILAANIGGTDVVAAPVVETSIENLPNLASSGVLLALNMSVWEAAKKDKSSEEDIKNLKGAGSKRAHTVRKHLFAECQALDNIKALRGEARLWFNKVTMEWNTPFRYCTTLSYFETTADFSNLKMRFDNLVNIFLGVYQTEISKQAFMLGASFNPNEYPSVEEVRRKFRFELDEGPVPLPTDFRVSITNEALKEMQERCARNTEARMKAMMSDVWGRVKDRVEHIKERMDAVLEYEPGQVEEEKEYDDAGNCTGVKIIKKRRPKLHDTMLDHAIELTEMLRQFNVFNDPKLEEARQMLKSAIIHVDMKSLKEDSMAQGALKSKMQDILDKFDF